MEETGREGSSGKQRRTGEMGNWGNRREETGQKSGQTGQNQGKRQK